MKPPLLRVADKLLAQGERQIAFESERRPDFIEQAITLTISADRAVKSIEFYCSDSGVSKWSSGRGLGSTRRWESEGQIVNETRFGYGKVRLLNGEDRRGEHPEVRQMTDALPDDEFKHLVVSALQNPRFLWRVAPQALQ